MIAMVDIPAEELHQAMIALETKKGVCRHLPQARFLIYESHPWFVFNGLVCDGRPHKMAGKNTGIAAGACTNCLLEEQTT